MMMLKISLAVHQEISMPDRTDSPTPQQHFTMHTFMTSRTRRLKVSRKKTFRHRVSLQECPKEISFHLKKKAYC